MGLLIFSMWIWRCLTPRASPPGASPVLRKSAPRVSLPVERTAPQFRRPHRADLILLILASLAHDSHPQLLVAHGVVEPELHVWCRCRASSAPHVWQLPGVIASPYVGGGILPASQPALALLPSSKFPSPRESGRDLDVSAAHIRDLQDVKLRLFIFSPCEHES